MSSLAATLRPRARILVGTVSLFLLLSVAYSFSMDMRASRSASITGDEPFYLLTTQSLIQDHDLDLRNQYEFETYRTFFDHPDRLWRQAGPLGDGRLLSPHDPGLSVLLIPGFRLGGLEGAQLQLLLMAALTFALAFVLAALETKHAGWSWLACAGVGLTAPAFVYSTEVYPEMPAALCVVGALLALRIRPGFVRAALVAFILSSLAWLGIKYVPVGLAVAAAFVLRADRNERLAFATLCCVSGSYYAWWHLMTFGALTPYNSNLVYNGASTTAVVESHLAFDDRIYRIWGLFVDRRFGIGRWAPVFLLMLPALPCVRRSISGGNAVVAVIVTQVLVATFASITMMGWWFPGRMLVVVLPLFAISLAAILPRMAPAARWVVGGLAVYGAAVTAALAQAAHSGEVTIAVDPFAMDAALFHLPGHAFPLYTWWTTETQLLNAAWLFALVISTAVVAAWPHRARTGRSPLRLPAGFGARTWNWSGRNAD